MPVLPHVSLPGGAVAKAAKRRRIPDLHRHWTTAGAALALSVALVTQAGAQATLPALALPDPMTPPSDTMLVPVPADRIEAAIATLDDLGETYPQNTCGSIVLGYLSRACSGTCAGARFPARCTAEPRPVERACASGTSQGDGAVL